MHVFQRSGRGLFGALALVFALVLTPSLAPPAAAAGDDDDVDRTKVWTKVTPAGEVVVMGRIKASAATVREFLVDAERAHSLASTTQQVRATRDGDCQKVKLSTRGITSPLLVETRRCPTTTGFTEVMLSSPDFLEYRNEWTIQQVGDYVLLTYVTRTVPDLAIPESIINSQARRVLAKVMQRLAVAVGDG